MPASSWVAASGRVAAAPRAHRARARRGLLNGRRLAPNDSSWLPYLLAKGTFTRTLQTVDQRRNKKGEVTGEVCVQQPRLDLHILRLDTLTFHQLALGTEPSGTIPRRVQHRRPPRALQRVARAARPRAAPGDARSRRPRTPDRVAQPRPPSVPAAGGADPGGALSSRSRREPSAPGRGRHREVDRGAFDRRCPRTQPLRRDERGFGASRHHPTWPPSCVQDAGRLPTAPAPELDRSGKRRSSGCARADRSGALGPRPAGRDLRLEPETAKLGSSIAGVAGTRCPDCGHPLPEGSPESFAAQRLRCQGEVVEPSNPFALLARDLGLVLQRSLSRPSLRERLLPYLEAHPAAHRRALQLYRQDSPTAPISPSGRAAPQAAFARVAGLVETNFLRLSNWEHRFWEPFRVAAHLALVLASFEPFARSLSRAGGPPRRRGGSAPLPSVDRRAAGEAAHGAGTIGRAPARHRLRRGSPQRGPPRPRARDAPLGRDLGDEAGSPAPRSTRRHPSLGDVTRWRAPHS